MVNSILQNEALHCNITSVLERLDGLSLNHPPALTAIFFLKQTKYNTRIVYFGKVLASKNFR